MSDAQAILFRKKRLQAFRGRGKLYSWLRAHREKIAVGLAAGEYTWAMLCAECARHGVMSRQGGPPERTAAWKAWQTLCRDLAASGESPGERPPRRVYPSQTPKGWVPPGIAAAIAAGNPAVEGARAVDTGAEASAGTALVPLAPPPPPVPPARAEGKVPFSRLADPDDPPEVHAAYAELEEQFDKADWYLMAGSSKKRRSE
jgi:hypothetical protein